MSIRLPRLIAVPVGRSLTLPGHRQLAEPAGFGIVKRDGRIGWALFLDDDLLDDGVSIGDPVEIATSVLTDLFAEGTRVFLSVHADRHDTARSICKALGSIDGIKAIPQRGVLGGKAREHAAAVLDDPSRVEVVSRAGSERDSHCYEG